MNEAAAMSKTMNLEVGRLLLWHTFRALLSQMVEARSRQVGRIFYLLLVQVVELWANWLLISAKWIDLSIGVIIGKPSSRIKDWFTKVRWSSISIP